MFIERIWKNIFATILMMFVVGALQAQTVLHDLSGKPAKIDDYVGKGKWLVVMFWASDCHVCNREAYQYVDFHFTHADTDASVLGVSLDGEANKKLAENFIIKHNVNFPNLIGEPEDIAQLFTELTGIPWRGTPTFLIYSPKGELLVQQIGAVPIELIEKFIASHGSGSVKKK